MLLLSATLSSVVVLIEKVEDDGELNPQHFCRCTDAKTMAIAQIILLLTTTIVSCCVYGVEVVPLALKSMIADSSDEVTMMSSSPAMLMLLYALLTKYVVSDKMSVVKRCMKARRGNLG